MNNLNENIINFADAMAEYDQRGKPSDQVQLVIQRQKLQMKEEMDKYQKQNQLRNYAQNILGSIYGNGDLDNSELRKQNDDPPKRVKIF